MLFVILSTILLVLVVALFSISYGIYTVADYIKNPQNNKDQNIKGSILIAFGFIIAMLMLLGLFTSKIMTDNKENIETLIIQSYQK